MATIPAKRPVTLNQVVLRRGNSINGILAITASALLGTVVMTTDGKNFTVKPEDWDNTKTYAVDLVVYHNGHTWQNTEVDNANEPGTVDSLWTDLGEWKANGILIENAETSGTYTILTDGDVRQKHLDGFNEAMRIHLYNKNIYLK